MRLYTTEQTERYAEHTFAFTRLLIQDHVLRLTFARSEKKNALHPQMVNEIAFAFQIAQDHKEVWMMLIEAEGSVFCAGADLKAMMGLASPNDSTIPDADGEILLGELFRKLNKPVICKVAGDVYAGGFLFLAGAQIVLAAEGIKLGLPEVKRGLFPFQVMASLLQVMPARKVLDWCIRGYNLPVQEGERYGLITETCPPDALDARVESVLTEMKQNSPKAVSLGLQAYDHIRPSSEQHQYLLDMFRQAMMSADGQEGMKAFREKRAPIWRGE
ncbi:MAG: enoyl-CoA hydratase-related protein [Bacteroidota bacterium]